MRWLVGLGLLFVPACHCDEGPAAAGMPMDDGGGDMSMAATLATAGAPIVETDPGAAQAVSLFDSMTARVGEALSQPAVAEALEALTGGPCYPVSKTPWCGTSTVEGTTLTLDFAGCSAQELYGRIVAELRLSDKTLLVWFDRFVLRNYGINGRACMILGKGDDLRFATCDPDANLTFEAPIIALDLPRGLQLETGFDLALTPKSDHVLFSGSAVGSVLGGPSVSVYQLAIGGRKIDQLDDPILLPVPAPCTCATSGTIGVKTEIRINGTTVDLQDDKGNTVTLRVEEEEPLLLNATMVAVRTTAKDATDCSAYTWAVPIYAYESDGTVYIDQGLDELVRSLDIACKSGKIDETQCDYWHAVLADAAKAEAMGCPASVSGEDLEQALILATEKLIASQKNSCSAPEK